MDATVATGAAAMMAIRVLLDHDVPEENINLVSLLMAESGIRPHEVILLRISVISLMHFILQVCTPLPTHFQM